jgi:hypothetical protein
LPRQAIAFNTLQLMSRTEDDFIRRTRRVVLATVALLACAQVGSVAGWRMHLSYEVNGRLRALQHAGLPISGAELNNWYASVPDQENAALVMTQAFALMRTFPDQRSNEISHFRPPARGQPLTPEQKVLLADYLALNAAALAKVRKAITLPRSRYPVDFSPSLAVLLPHLGELKRLTQAASYEALLTLDSNSNEDAAASITMILGLARTLDEEPMQISQLLRIGIVRIAATTLERSLIVGEWSDADLRGVGSAFAAAEKTNAMMRALIGERAGAIPYFRMSSREREEGRRSAPANEEGDTEPIESLMPGLVPLVERATGFFERDLGFYLGAMETNISLASLPFPRNLAVCTNIANQQELAANRNHYILSSLLLPGVGRILIRESACAARLITAQAALAVERFRLKNGCLPKDLSELVPGFFPAVPRDPFDGAPIRYKPLAKGYVAYSVGPDGHDDGGREPPVARRGTDHVPEDITITVER